VHLMDKSKADSTALKYSAAWKLFIDWLPEGYSPFGDRAGVTSDNGLGFVAHNERNNGQIVALYLSDLITEAADRSIGRN
jgi:hypothetical protein